MGAGGLPPPESRAAGSWISCGLDGELEPQGSERKEPGVTSSGLRVAPRDGWLDSFLVAHPVLEVQKSRRPSTGTGAPSTSFALQVAGMPGMVRGVCALRPLATAVLLGALRASGAAAALVRQFGELPGDDRRDREPPETERKVQAHTAGGAPGRAACGWGDSSAASDRRRGAWQGGLGAPARGHVGRARPRRRGVRPCADAACRGPIGAKSRATGERGGPKRHIRAGGRDHDRDHDREHDRERAGRAHRSEPRATAAPEAAAAPVPPIEPRAAERWPMGGVLRVVRPGG